MKKPEGRVFERNMSTTEDWLYSDDLDVGVPEVSEFLVRVCRLASLAILQTS